MILNREQLTYLVNGAALLGSGGGGALATGYAFIELILKNTKGQGVPLLTEPSDLKALACVLCDIGAITAVESDQQAAILYAFDALDTYQQEKMRSQTTVVMPIETGPENSLVPFVLASQRGLSVLDADAAGRAVPSLPLCALNLLPASPAFIANEYGEYLLAQTSDAASLDTLLRPITASPQFGNSASLSLWSASVADLWARAVKGTLSQSVWCGQLMSGLQTHNLALVAEALPHVNQRQGVILGRCKVVSVTQNESGAFDFGTIKLADQQRGGLMTILTQNENLIIFNSLESSPLLTAPHTISYLKTDFSPLTNSEIKVGDEVFVLGIAASEQLQTPAILVGFSALLAQLGYGGKLPALPAKLIPLGSLLSTLQS